MLVVALEIKTEPNSYIKVLPENVGIYSDAKGYAKVQVKPGEKAIIITHIAYKVETTKVFIKRDTLLKISLVPKSYILPEVFVSAEDKEFKGKTFEPYRINYEVLQNSPNFIEPDPLRVMVKIPSVKFASDLGLKVSVMNSPPEETPFFLDGIRIFNPVHLGGLSSVLDVNLLSYMEFYPMPYYSNIYGLSGSVNLKSINFLTAQNKNFLDLSFISAKGGFIRNSGNWYLTSSLRGFHLGYISLLADRNLPYIFYDGFLKGGWNFRWGEVGFAALGSNGMFDYKSERTTIRADWKNTIIYTYLNSGNFSFKTYYADYENRIFSSLLGMRPEGEDVSYKDNPINFLGIRAEYDGGWLSIGYNGEYYKTEYYSINPYRLRESKPFINWAYIQITYPTSYFVLSTGLRGNGKYFDPNLSLKTFITGTVSLRGFFATSTDYFYGFPMENSGGLRFYYFMPSFYTFTDLPQRAYFWGLEILRRAENYSAFVQLIYRNYLRIYDDFIPKTGFAKGINLGYNGNFLGGSSSIWYSYVIREPKTFMDSPNSFGFSYARNLRGKSVGLSFYYHTGYPKDGERYPDYHRLDVYISGKLKILKAVGYWNFTVINLYNRKNVFLVYYDYREGEYKTVPQLPLAPTLSIGLQF
ncbi:MAG: hypothetical protein ABIL16_02970 [candidate division WOR-3 bacterium]